MNFDGLVKKSICGVALQLRHCGAPVSAPHSSVFARLASGAFYETIVLLTFYEIINFYIYTRTPSSSSNLPSRPAGSKKTLSLSMGPQKILKKGKNKVNKDSDKRCGMKDRAGKLRQDGLGREIVGRCRLLQVFLKGRRDEGRAG